MTGLDRIRKRRKLLLNAAKTACWKNWYEFETAVINEEIDLPSKSGAIKVKSKGKERPSNDKRKNRKT